VNGDGDWATVDVVPDWPGLPLCIGQRQLDATHLPESMIFFFSSLCTYLPLPSFGHVCTYRMGKTGEPRNATDERLTT
jgi:hypothetical protein